MWGGEQKKLLIILEIGSLEKKKERNCLLLKQLNIKPEDDYLNTFEQKYAFC